MFNKRFGFLNDENLNNKGYTSDFIAMIADLLRQDSMADGSLGSVLEDKYILDLCKFSSANLPEGNFASVTTDEFTEEITLAIKDCFKGMIVGIGMGLICCILPNQTVFKIQIAKL